MTLLLLEDAKLITYGRISTYLKNRIIYDVMTFSSLAKTIGPRKRPDGT